MNYKLQGYTVLEHAYNIHISSLKAYNIFLFLYKAERLFAKFSNTFQLLDFYATLIFSWRIVSNIKEQMSIVD